MLNRQKLRLLAATFSLVFSTQIFASNDEPVILKQPQNISECVGGTEKLTMTLNEGVKATVQWQYSSDKRRWYNVIGATEASFTPDSKEAKTTWYRVAISTTDKIAATTFTTPVKVEVAETPTVQAVLASKDYVCVDGKLTMKAIRSGGAGDCTIQWQSSSSENRNWQDIEGETKAEFTAPALSKDVSYRAVTFCTGSGCCNRN
jgi:GH24 family phage-related lysozyme (muramidase)